ncbi:MAG: NAD-dependent succinate-semialdehyde dehydrogenase [Acidobacteria bacterium]|nr:MAG: NAD-dependent succinate-semialdehyde dehydrogenase [Acidobacteriota bacterium]
MRAVAYTYKQYIDGEWVDASNGATWDVINPATEEVIRTVPYGNGEDAKGAIQAAARAFPAWRASTAYERAAILKRAADIMRARLDELARTSVQECGKPAAQARAEWGVVADLFEWFAEEGKRAYGRTIPSRAGGKRLTVLKQPMGVAGVITAWNFPAYNPGRAWAAAMAAGCTVVGRASEYTPLTAMEMANIVAEAGVPPGVLNLVNGEPDPMGQAMLDDPACRKISFTGSVRVGKLLMDGASRTVTRLGLELGGNAPVLIFPDVDLEEVAKGSVATKYRNDGQVCIAPQRFLVHRKVNDEFLERVVPRVKSLRLGDGLDPQTQVGPLINARQRDRVDTMVADARRQGVEVLAGGSRLERKGYFYEPTVLAQVQPSMPVYAEEIFGPVMPVVPFDELEQAIAIANDTGYGLAAYVWTRDMKTALRAYEGLEFGMIGVNDWAPNATEAPFGGWKQSGIGHECGQEGLEDYLETKLVTIGGL